MNKAFKKHLTTSAQRISYVVINDKNLGMSLMQVIGCAPKLKKPNVINLTGCLDEYSAVTMPTFFDPVPIEFFDNKLVALN